GGGRKSAGQAAFAEPGPGREFADLERAVQVQVDVLLDLVHDQVVVRSFPAERDVGELAGAVPVDQEDLGGEVGAVVTGETFDEVQDQGQERGRPARGDHVAVIDDHPFGGDLDRRVAPLQLVSEHPVRGRRPAVQEAGGGDEESAGARTGDLGSACLPAG